MKIVEIDFGPLPRKLSGGEQQRIKLARLMLQNPQCALIDEGTSALDSETENHVQRSLEEQFTGRTIVVIAYVTAVRLKGLPLMR